jgi:sugar (pentulose or hexulose) kinase
MAVPVSVQQSMRPLAWGIYESYEEAVEKMVKVKDVFTPKPENVAVYKRLNEEVYQGLTDYTDEVLKKTYSVLHPEG